jgi:hypothetical protein
MREQRAEVATEGNEGNKEAKKEENYDSGSESERNDAGAELRR